MYAVTPCHVGSGASVGVVDLPIQRERHSNWPIIHSSGMKGALRAHFDRFKDGIKAKPQQETFAKITELIFGADTQNGDHAGSLTIGDARILAFPMRSNIAPFVWITCPAALKRLNKDLALAKKEPLDIAKLNDLTDQKAMSINGSFQQNSQVLLEDMEVTVSAELKLTGLADKLFQEAERLLVVSDEVFGYGVSDCTSVMAQIKIDQQTGTTATGSLRYQEELPADSLMYSLIFWGDSRDTEKSLQAAAIKDYIQKEVVAGHLQVGGDQTLGRGIFALNWL
jgi:CRISPR-associated protein Cmr4